jgi:hypothetical protein
MSSPDVTTPSRAGGRTERCPICGGAAAARYRPFCSKRCAELDLGRWFDERYRVPSEEPADPGELPQEDAP